MYLSSATAILGLYGAEIGLDDIPDGSRVSVKGTESQGSLSVSEVRVIGGRTFTGEGEIGQVDVANRLITPEPDPPLSVHVRAYIGDQTGRRITLAVLADFLDRDPTLVVSIVQDPFGPGVSSVQLIDPEFGRYPGPDERFFRAAEIQVDVEGQRIMFNPSAPVLVAEDASILGADGETLTLSDLRTGQRAYVRGEQLGDQITVTGITLIPQVDLIQVVPVIGDLDGGGVENDVRVDILDQDGEEIALPVDLFLDFSAPFGTRSGHIFTNLPPGPHVVEAHVPSHPELGARERVFISARGSALKVVETSPEAQETGVGTTTDITVTFNEPLRQFGDFIAIAAELSPPPESGSLKENMDLGSEGKAVVFRDVQLAEGSDYTFAVSSATSSSGNILAQPLNLQFSTGAELAQVGTLSGAVTLTEEMLFVGKVWLFDRDGEQMMETPLQVDGGFAFEVFGGSYRVSAEVRAEDGRSASGFLDVDGDGSPDEVTLADGESVTGLSLSLALPEVSVPSAGGGPNADASVLLDLDARADNQALEALQALPGSDVRVALYASGVQDLIGFNVLFTYDSTAVSFQGVDEEAGSEINILKKNAALAVTLPPLVSASTVEYSGAILGATEFQAVSGDGLLGVFRFKTRQDFSTASEFLVPRVLLQSRAVADTLRPLARATVDLATTRILIKLTAEPDTVDADGKSTANITADLRDADGQVFTEETEVRFGIASGSGALTESEVTTGTGQASTQLTSQVAGPVVVEVSTGAASEEIRVVFESAEEPQGPPTGPRGPIALDLDLNSGDQEQVQTTSVPQAGETVTIDVAAVSGAMGMTGFQVRLEYDPAQLEWKEFRTTDLWATGFAIPPSPSEGVVEINVAILGSTTSADAGSMGHASFVVLDAFTGETRVKMITASYDTPVEAGAGGAEVVIGGDVPEPSEPSPDFDGDGEVGFTDFIMFAGAFGSATGEADWDVKFDLDQDGSVGFTDFITFAGVFGTTVGKPAARKPVQYGGGANGEAEASLACQSVGGGEALVLVSVAGAGDVRAYGTRVMYDPAALELESAEGLAGSVFGRDGVALQVPSAPGEIFLGDALSAGSLRQGDVDLLQLHFRVLGEVPGWVEISEVVLADGNGALDLLPGVRLEGVRDLPDAIGLGHNFPNPFNPQTVVPFSLPQPGKVRIAVYNLLGQKVVVLEDGHRPAGYHRVVWNGRDAQDRSVSSGIYLVRMDAGGYAACKKVLLLR